MLKCKLEDLSLQTIDDYHRKLGRFLDYCGDCSIRDVSPVVIRQFLGDVKDRYQLDTASVQRHLVSIKAFFNWAYEEGFFDFKPTVGVRVGHVVKKIVRGLSEEQIRKLLEVVSDGSSVFKSRHGAIVYLLVDCGLRISEVMNLKVTDVDLEHGVLKVSGKGSKERLVRMGFSTRKMLWRYMGSRIGNSVWLWLNSEGGRCERSVVQHWIKGLGRRMGFPLHAHLLRHTFAISFLRNGGNVFALQAALGHSSLEMTRRYCQALGFDEVFKSHELASPVDNALKRV
jgi:site-specific recombinase XerD